MSIPATIPQAILDTVLGRLAVLFLAATLGDITAARAAAEHMLATYNPQTPGELTLAAEIVSLQFHSLEALAQATGAGISLNQQTRLRGSAVSLTRESHKARRRLDQLQKSRQTAAPTPLDTETALDLVATAQDAIRIAQKTGGHNWRQNLQKRLETARMTEKIKQNQAKLQPAA